MPQNQLQEFYERVALYEKSRNQGFGFEAPGTLGRSFYALRRRRRRSRILLPLLITSIILISLKGGIMHVIGPTIYAERVAELQSGEGIDRIGALIMAPEPVSAYVAGRLKIWGL